MRRALVLLFVIPTVAGADDKDARDLGHGYRLEVTQSGLVVTKGGQRATLQRGVIALDKVAIAGTKTEVDVEDTTCTGTHHYTWTFDHLDARLANAAAFVLHERKSYKDAAIGFAKAAASDPSWAIPAYNLASARTLLGDLDGAIAALAPRLASEPITTYVHVSSDPELRPLLARKELTAIRAKTRGTTTLADNHLAYAASRGLVAISHEEQSGGSLAFETTLEIYDIHTSQLVASFPLVQWADTDPGCPTSHCIKPSARATVADRKLKAEAMLDELGFVDANVELAQADWEDYKTKAKAYLSNAKLGVASANGAARVLRGNTVLATATGLRGRLESVMYVESLHLFVLWMFVASGDGCDGYPEKTIGFATIAP